MPVRTNFTLEERRINRLEPLVASGGSQDCPRTRLTYPGMTSFGEDYNADQDLVTINRTLLHSKNSSRLAVVSRTPCRSAIQPEAYPYLSGSPQQGPFCWQDCYHCRDNRPQPCMFVGTFALALQSVSDDRDAFFRPSSTVQQPVYLANPSPTGI